VRPSDADIPALSANGKADFFCDFRCDFDDVHFILVLVLVVRRQVGGFHSVWFIFLFFLCQIR